MSHLPMDSSPLVLLSILLLSFPLAFSQKPHALVAPVTKDPSTLQYVARVNQRTPLVPVNLVVYLGGRYLWVDCEKGYVSSTFQRPEGCNNYTCEAFPYNPVIQASINQYLYTDVFSVRSTDGSKSGRAVTDPHFLFSCAPTYLVEGLAHGATGMIGLGQYTVATPQQLAATFGFQRAFAICLTNQIGFMFFGGGPYVFQPGIALTSKSLIYTPLLVNPKSIAPSSMTFKGDKSSEYFIGVTSIRINEKPIKLNRTLLKIKKDGSGGTKISTVDPYTLLERSIYEAVVRAFGDALSGVKRVAPVAPFGLCFDANSIGGTRVGPAVPSIDLVLQSNSVYWRIFGGNSMVSVGNDALCLGFVDAGINPTTSIVIGGYQLEDNLLEFDLARSRLGFSSSLSFRQTSCANFNYTT